MILVSAQAFPPRLGGIQNLMAGFATYAAGAGHRVRVLADGGLKARAADRASPPVYGIDRFWGPRPLRRRAKALTIRRLAATGRVRALYADSWKSLRRPNPFKTVKESTCTPELVQLVNGIQ